MKKESVLREKMEKIESIIDISKIIDGDANSVRKIKKYYRINDLAYRLFHSDRGFMHFRVSKGDKYTDDDILYQPNVISEYIPKNATVLELGSGQGANIAYLAKKHPDSSFIGIDLYPKLPKDAPDNIEIHQHDYSDMPFIQSNSIDIVYGIETIVHCSDKKKVFKEINRVLKKGGILVLYDYTLSKEFEKLLPYEQKAMQIISKGGAAALIESLKSWTSYFKYAGFKEIKTTDLHKDILPDLKHLERGANRIMRKNSRIKLCMFLLPSTFVNNVLLGWLGYDAYNEGIGYYMEWIYKK